jgi:hypothetical protein
MRLLEFSFAWLLLLAVGSIAVAWQSEPFTDSEWFDEQTLTQVIEPQVRLHVNVPRKQLPGSPARLLIYATPNGNTIEQTLGCKMVEGLDRHYDIQHVAAQIRLVRNVEPNERLILVCAEADGLSWPAWRREHEEANQTISDMVDDWRMRFGGKNAVVTLAAHSGGGSFLFGWIEAQRKIPDWLDRIVFLDANYSFDAKLHGKKLQQWLNANDSRQLIVIAYDDRRITFRGKQVVGPDGGTFRATNRMVSALQDGNAITQTDRPPLTMYTGLHGRLRFEVHSNPENKILHTALVGEMNGLAHALTVGTPWESKWGGLKGPRAYTAWIQPAPQTANVRRTLPDDDPLPSPFPLPFPLPFPARPADAVGGMAFMKRMETLSPDDREASALREITAGNFPNFLRELRRVPISAKMPDGKQTTGVMEVMCDYLAIGSDDDFVRIPLRPQTAQSIADRFECVLPTRKIVDAIDAHAELHLEPRPLTENRESVSTFVQHHQIIESQRRHRSSSGGPLGALITGIKKDVVLSPRIFERPNRLAIYGWRRRDGRPIQNLSVVHVDHYVDYSHGIRLVRNRVEVDGQRLGILDLLQDEQRCALVSDEGPMVPPRYPDRTQIE